MPIILIEKNILSDHNIDYEHIAIAVPIQYLSMYSRLLNKVTILSDRLKELSGDEILFLIYPFTRRVNIKNDNTIHCQYNLSVCWHK